MSKKSENEKIFEERSGVIKNIRKASFQIEGGKTMYGVEVTMDNQDCPSEWSAQKEDLKEFVEGREIQYVMKRIEEPGKKPKFRFESYMFPDGKVVDERSGELKKVRKGAASLTHDLSNNMGFAARYATDLVISVMPQFTNKNGIPKLPSKTEMKNVEDLWEQTYKRMYEVMREVRVNETFEFPNENKNDEKE